MSEFDNLKGYYVSVIQCAMAMNAGYQQTKQANEIFHKGCEMLVDSSNNSYQDKQGMKFELLLLKKSLEEEIELFYGSRTN